MAKPPIVKVPAPKVLGKRLDTVHPRYFEREFKAGDRVRYLSKLKHVDGAPATVKNSSAVHTQDPRLPPMRTVCEIELDQGGVYHAPSSNLAPLLSSDEIKTGGVYEVVPGYSLENEEANWPTLADRDGRLQRTATQIVKWSDFIGLKLRAENLYAANVFLAMPGDHGLYLNMACDLLVPVEADPEPTNCICDLRITWGCKCGWIEKERAARRERGATA